MSPIPPAFRTHLEATGVLSNHPVVYLIHFKDPFGHAQHYCGASLDLISRISAHACSSGGRLLQVANQAGIEWEVVRVWDARTYVPQKVKKNKAVWELERRIKAVGGHARVCPICNPRARQRGEFCVSYMIEEERCLQ